MISEQLEQILSDTNKYLLCFGENWDGEGAPEFSKEAMDQVGYLLRAVYNAQPEILPKLLRVSISPVTDGTIDLFWCREPYLLLVNVQADGIGITFSAIGPAGTISGNVESKTFQPIATCLSYK